MSSCSTGDDGNNFSFSCTLIKLTEYCKRSSLTGYTVSLPRLLSPRPAEARMSRPTGQMRDGDGPFGAGFNTTEGEEDDTPLLSRPNRNFLASYMFTAFLSTLFTITD